MQMSGWAFSVAVQLRIMPDGDLNTRLNWTSEVRIPVLFTYVPEYGGRGGEAYNDYVEECGPGCQSIGIP